jgi:signal transduction histidine kinase
VKRKNLSSGVFICILVTLCVLLGALQYTWNAEVSGALRDRLRASLQASLMRLSRELNSVISDPSTALTPASFRDRQSAEAEIAARFDRWKKTSGRSGMLSRLAVVAREGDRAILQVLDPATGNFAPSAWPAEWKATEDLMEAMAALPMPGGRGRGGPPNEQGPRQQGPRFADEGAIFEWPLFAEQAEGATPRRPGDFGRGPSLWLIVEIDRAYIADALLPEVLQRHLGTGGNLDYDVEVVNRAHPENVIYRSDRGLGDIRATADGSVNLFEVSWMFNAGRGGPGGPPAEFARGMDFGPGRGMPPDTGRWQMFVRHKGGSLAAVVAKTRWQNLGVTGAVLVFMLATVGAWVRLTRRAQRLAELQMEFVAGVSHELRTPLTVIHTAAYNLQGKLAANPAQVERYGKLIQQHSGRLKEIVEQVLQFSSANAGRAVQRIEPVEIGDVIQRSIEARAEALEEAHCELEQSIDPGVPLVAGDPRALQLVLENLLDNAAKYSANGKGWIGIFVSSCGEAARRMVEIQVADRGVGIPPDEQRHIFDPFFRGQRAVEDGAHGTGLGLALVKKIVEAHGGSVTVSSSEGKGTVFVLRIPVFEAAEPSLERTP